MTVTDVIKLVKSKAGVQITEPVAQQMLDNLSERLNDREILEEELEKVTGGGAFAAIPQPTPRPGVYY